LHADAKIIGDVGCIHCAYNLRGLRTVGTCPECGHAIAESLFVLVRPQLVADCFRGLSNSYLTFLILVLGCFFLLQGWPVLVTAIVLASGSAYRVWRAGELHYRADLGNSAALASSARHLWLASLFELCAAAGWVGTIFLVRNTPALQTAGGSQLILQCGAIWLLTTLVNALLAGRLGGIVATILGLEWLVIEFRVHHWVMIVAMLTVPLLFVLLHAPPAMTAGLIIACVIGLLLMVAATFTWMALHHIGNAAEGATETLEDVIERE
jgi:hypothetical protein